MALARLLCLCSIVVLAYVVLPAAAMDLKAPPGFKMPDTVQIVPAPLEPGHHSIQVLIITGRSTFQHDWVGTTNALRRMLQETGRFEVRVTEEFRGASAETLKPYDLVILNYSGSWEYIDPNEIRWGKVPEKALFDFVKNGGGIVVYHSSFNLGATGWPEYEKLAGGTLRGTPPLETRRVPAPAFLIHVADPNDPITKGMRDYQWDLDDDLLVHIHWDPQARIHVLATGHEEPSDYDPKLESKEYPPAVYNPENAKKFPGMGQDNPVVWTLNYGKGRVFAMMLGHTVDTLEQDSVRSLIERGSEWAATGAVTIPVRPGARP